MKKQVLSRSGGRGFSRAVVLFLGALLTSLLILAGWIYHIHALNAQADRTQAAARDYGAAAYEIERGFIESLPIYQDYASPQKEARLRTHLLNDHLQAAVRFGTPAVRDEAQIQSYLQAGRLLALENTPDTLFYYYNVPRGLRFLTPGAALGLERIGARFQEILRERAGERPAPPPVKFAISSMLRPTAYQTNLRGRNANASLNSSHSHGVSFDIFYDEYYVRLPGALASLAEPEARVQEALRARLGFLLGASLRRQFRSALTETLLQLQDEGLLYAILEKNQRCYHVTILR
jgi:hypothetical protein